MNPFAKSQAGMYIKLRQPVADDLRPRALAVLHEETELRGIVDVEVHHFEDGDYEIYEATGWRVRPEETA